MNKMTIIQLLNKIANGEEVPKEFIWNDRKYYLQSDKCYKCDETSTILEEDFIVENLNDEVEVCSTGLTVKEAEENLYKFSEALYKEANKKREKKIPEKLKIEQDTPTSNYYIRNENGTKCALTKHSKMIAETLNQVIDYLDYLKSKGDE